MGFVTATELTNRDDEIQAVMLKTVMGRECRQIISCIMLSNAYKKKLNKILKRLYIRTLMTGFVKRVLY